VSGAACFSDFVFKALFPPPPLLLRLVLSQPIVPLLFVSGGVCPQDHSAVQCSLVTYLVEVLGRVPHLLRFVFQAAFHWQWFDFFSGHSWIFF